MKIKRRILLIELVMLGMLCVLNLSDAQLVYGKEPIKIGYSTDFSGVTAQFGIVEAPVAKMVVEEVNKAGGINGRKIELFILDNGSALPSDLDLWQASAAGHQTGSLPPDFSCPLI